jgi:hypothetical protein
MNQTIFIGFLSYIIFYKSYELGALSAFPQQNWWEKHSCSKSGIHFSCAIGKNLIIHVCLPGSYETGRPTGDEKGRTTARKSLERRAVTLFKPPHRRTAKPPPTTILASPSLRCAAPLRGRWPSSPSYRRPPPPESTRPSLWRSGVSQAPLHINTYFFCSAS